MTDPFTIVSTDGVPRTYDATGKRIPTAECEQTITLAVETSQMENCKRQAALERERERT